MNYPESYIKKCTNCPEINNQVLSMDEMVLLCKGLACFTTCTDLKLVSKMRIGIAEMYCDTYLNTQSIWDFWIMFYVRFAFGKEWHDGKHAWIPYSKKR